MSFSLRLLACLLCVSALVSILTPRAVAVSPNWDGCWGCNIVDGGQINSNLIGVTLYTDGGTRLVVQQVDIYNSQVLVRNSQGATYWMSGTRLYDASNKEERNVTTAGVVGAGIFALLLGSSSNNRSGSSNNSSRDSRYQCERRCEQTTHHFDPGRQTAAENQCKRRCG